MNYKFWAYILTLFSTIFLFTGCSKKNSEELTNQVKTSPTQSSQASLEIDLDSIPELGAELIEEAVEDNLPDIDVEEILEDTNTDIETPVIEETKKTMEEIRAEEEKIFWQNETTRLTNELSSIALAVQSDYIKIGTMNGWYSNNGKLTNYYEQTPVTINGLTAENSVETNLSNSEYELLLINGTDIATYPNSTVQPEAMRFGVFASMLTEKGYLICSPYGKAAILTEAEYSSLLSLYVSNHGDISQLSSASVEYGRILNFISLFEGRFDEYFVREIRMDNKYAVVVFSSKSNAGNVRQYILRNSNDFWEVALPDAQTILYPITTVNQYLPDFNLNLLPSYNLATWQNNITTDQGGAIAALFQLRAIESQEDIYYLCATNSHAYVILHNGKKYCIYIENNIWKAIEVQTDREARNLFKSLAGIDYGFLVLDD